MYEEMINFAKPSRLEEDGKSKTTNRNCIGTLGNISQIDV